MEKIFHKNILFAIRLKAFRVGSNPITAASESLQVMTIKRKAGEAVKPHRHIPRRRLTKKLQECLIIRRGRVKVDLYGADKKIFKSLVLKAGDILIILGGGHGLEYLEPTEILELKNGPYVDDKQLI